MNLFEVISDLSYQIADMKRRQSNFIRPATAVSFDPAKNTVIADLGGGVKTHPMPAFNHAGSGKHWHPFKKGQQITLLCPDGDLSNAFVLPGGFHDQNAAPSSSADEDIVAQRGTSRLRTTDSAAFLECGGARIEVKEGVITLHAKKIVLDGAYYLGGADADKPVAMLGTIDTGGYSDVSNLSTTGFTQ